MMPGFFRKSGLLNLLLYGLSLGLLLATLQFGQYRLLLYGQSWQWFLGLIALLFTVVGIWAGRKWDFNGKISSPRTTPPEVAVHSKTPEQFGITVREMEVLKKMAQGLSNQEIADALFISLNTVKTHIAALFSKLDVQRRTQAVQKAKETGLL